MRKRLTIAVVVVLVVAVVAGGLLWWREHDRTDLERAASMAPADAERISWTDWAAVRREVGVRPVGGLPGRRAEAVPDKGYTPT